MSIDNNVYIGSYLLVKTKRGINDLFCRYFHDEDLFRVVKIHGIKGQMLVPNNEKQGGLYIEDMEGAWDIPQQNFSHTSWDMVMDMFSKEGIEFIKKTGIVIWYS